MSPFWLVFEQKWKLQKWKNSKPANFLFFSPGNLVLKSCADFRVTGFLKVNGNFENQTEDTGLTKKK